MSVASVIDPMRAANRLAKQQLFDWQILSKDGSPVRLAGSFEFKADGAFSAAVDGDFLIVVASFKLDAVADSKLLQDMRKKVGNFHTLCAVEAGTWLLARAGIVTSHNVTTHWEDTESLQQRFPDLEVRRDRYVIDGNIWTCGGASPAFDMMLNLIRLCHGKTLALDVASVFIYDQVHAPTDTQPNISLGRLAISEPRIAEAVRIMERTVDSPIPVSAIARRIRLSVRGFEMLARQHLGATPGAYYLQLRLLQARKLVIDTRLTLQEISVRCGFTSQSAFSRSFSRQFGASPTTLRRSTT
jgi:transcriptional regulator GlxA family with amidase domain